MDRARLQRRNSDRYLDRIVETVDEATERANTSNEKRKAVAIGVVGYASDIFPALLERHEAGDIKVDIVTDQTSAHDPLSYLPSEVRFEDWDSEAKADPETFTKKSRES